MSTLAIDHKTVVYLTAANALPQLIADCDGDDPDEMVDIVRTAVEFGLELVEQVEAQFAPDCVEMVDETEKHAS